MRLLGIDPGVATTGWAIVDFKGNRINEDLDIVDYGVISTSKHKELPLRLQEIYEDIIELIGKYKPECVGIETLLFCNNAKTAISVGEARGVVLLGCRQKDLSIYEFTPLQIKNTITGYGNADKKQVQESLQIYFNLDEIPKPDDAADAIAITVCTYDKVLNVQRLESN